MLDAPAAAARGSLAIWRCLALVWRRRFWSSMATNVANPLLFLFAFGFGLGAAIDRMAGIDYLAFVVPGVTAYSAMFAASYEATIGAFNRFSQQRTWDAILATPVMLLDLLLGEVLWAASKAMIPAVCVLVVGYLWGGVPSALGALASLPIVFVASVSFATQGLAATAFAKSYEFFSYYFTFWITPMFVFSGVFFDVDRFPDYVQIVSWLLPMTHLIQVIRPLTAGTELEPASAALHLGYIVVLSGLMFLLAYRRIAKRMFD